MTPKISTDSALHTLNLEGREGVLRDHIELDSNKLAIGLPHVHSAEYARGFSRSVGAVAKRLVAGGLYKQIAAQNGVRPITTGELFARKVFGYPRLLERGAQVMIDGKQTETYSDKDIRDLDGGDMLRFHPGAKKQVLIVRAILETTNAFAHAPEPAPQTRKEHGWTAAAKETLLTTVDKLSDDSEPFRRELRNLVRRYTPQDPK